MEMHLQLGQLLVEPLVSFHVFLKFLEGDFVMFLNGVEWSLELLLYVTNLVLYQLCAS